MDTAFPGPIMVEAGALAPDATTLDVLARVQLAARRLGFEARLRNASGDLLDLIAFAGLDEVLRVELQRQPEEREQRLGLEEERELDDPPVLDP
jgi:hypothetical protein